MKKNRASEELMPFYNQTALFVDGADYTSFALGAGNLITAIRDKSPEGNNPVQATGSLQPALVPSVKNGNSVMRFDGTRYMTHASGLFTLPNSDNTIIAVAKRNTEDATTQYLTTFTEVGSVRNYIRFSPTAGNILYNSAAGTTGGISGTGNTNTEFQIIVAWKSGANQFISINGRTIFTNASAVNEPGIDGGQLGALAAGGFLTGDIGMIAMWRYGMSAQEINLTQNYLSKRWNIPLSV